jgi:hypothetical protein
MLLTKLILGIVIQLLLLPDVLLGDFLSLVELCLKVLYCVLKIEVHFFDLVDIFVTKVTLFPFSVHQLVDLGYFFLLGVEGGLEVSELGLVV